MRGKTAEDLTLLELLDPVAEAAGYAIVRLRLMGGATRRLQVMAERADGEMDIDDCARLSRAISEVLDAADPVSGEYVLEVSSPGVDRPLTRPKDFAAWAGHDVNVSLGAPAGGHKKLRGELLGVQDGKVQIEDRKHGRFAVPFEQIHSAKLVLTDKLIAATKPLDMSGADEIEEFNEEEKAQD